MTFNKIKKLVDKFIWFIPSSTLRNKIRYSFSSYIQKVLRLQNKILIKKINKQSYMVQQKEVKFLDKNSFLYKYNKLNNSYNKNCIFYVGCSAGFYSEFNNMILAMLYCLDNKIQFKIYSKTANFANGITEFFFPFCTEVYNNFNQFYNFRYITYPVDEENFIISDLIKRIYNISYFTYDIFDKMRDNSFISKNFVIEELNINGNFRHAFNIIAKNIYRFNSNTQKAIDSIVKSIKLPKIYIGCHIRSGDKIVEHPLVTADTYIKKIKEYTDIRDIFISSDDYSNIEYIRDNYKEFNVYTLENNQNRGYNQSNFDKLDNNSKRSELISFFASIDVLSKSHLCFGSFTSNPACFLAGIMDENRFIEIYSDSFKLV